MSSGWLQIRFLASPASQRFDTPGGSHGRRATITHTRGAEGLSARTVRRATAPRRRRGRRGRRRPDRGGDPDRAVASVGLGTPARSLRHATATATTGVGNPTGLGPTTTRAGLRTAPASGAPATAGARPSAGWTAAKLIPARASWTDKQIGVTAEHEDQTGSRWFLARGCPWHNRGGLRYWDCQCGSPAPTAGTRPTLAATARAWWSGWAVCATAAAWPGWAATAWSAAPAGLLTSACGSWIAGGRPSHR